MTAFFCCTCWRRGNEGRNLHLAQGLLYPDALLEPLSYFVSNCEDSAGDYIRRKTRMLLHANPFTLAHCSEHDPAWKLSLNIL